MSRSLHLRAVKIKLSFPQQIVEEHEHVRDTTHPPKHYGGIYVTRSLYEVTFPMSYRNVGSSCPHYRERRRSPHRTDSDALYAVGGGNTGPASSVTTNFTPYYLDKKHRREDTPVCRPSEHPSIRGKNVKTFSRWDFFFDLGYEIGRNPVSKHQIQFKYGE